MFIYVCCLIWCSVCVFVFFFLYFFIFFLFFFFFFFSSRRRHTRCGRDWGSDVCSSDLPRTLFVSAVGILQKQVGFAFPETDQVENRIQPQGGDGMPGRLLHQRLGPERHTEAGLAQHGQEIGRASCRERV